MTGNGERDRDLERRTQRIPTEIEPEEPRWRPGRPSANRSTPTCRPAAPSAPSRPASHLLLPTTEPEERSRYRPAPGPAPRRPTSLAETGGAFGEGLAADPFARTRTTTGPRSRTAARATNIPACIATTTRFRGGGTRALRERRRSGTEVALGSRGVRPDRRRAAAFPSLHGGAGDEPRFAREAASAARKPGGPASPCRRRLLVPNASLPAPPARTSNATALRNSSLPSTGTWPRRRANKMLPGNGTVPGPTTAPVSQAMSLAGNGCRRWNNGPARNLPSAEYGWPARQADCSRPRSNHASFWRLTKSHLRPSPAGRFGGRPREGNGVDAGVADAVSASGPSSKPLRPTAEEFPRRIRRTRSRTRLRPRISAPACPTSGLREEKLDDIDLDFDDLEPGEELEADDLEIDEDDVMVDDRVPSRLASPRKRSIPSSSRRSARRSRRSRSWSARWVCAARRGQAGPRSTRPGAAAVDGTRTRA